MLRMHQNLPTWFQLELTKNVQSEPELFASFIPEVKLIWFLHLNSLGKIKSKFPVQTLTLWLCEWKSRNVIVKEQYFVKCITSFRKKSL